MTQAASQDDSPSPWLSLWGSPAATIERIIANDPRRNVLLLSTFAGIAIVLLQFLQLRLSANAFDWRLTGLIVAVGVVAGAVNLYISGLLVAWSGRWLGGRASQEQVRAALAWSFLPMAASLALYLIVLFGLRLFSDQVLEDISDGLLIVGGALALWSLFLLIIMLGRVQNFGIPRAILNVAFGALLQFGLVVMIKTFLFEPFSIPSGHMRPTLLAGDQFLVSKFRFGLSLSFLSGRVLASGPNRGNVVVFRLRGDDSVSYVDRVIGLPGDEIQVTNGMLIINGILVKREQLQDTASESPCPNPQTKASHWREILPNGAAYETFRCNDEPQLPGTDKPYKVPSGEYFMLGDNRDNSMDSRFPSVGFIPLKNITGQAMVVFLSIARGEFRFDRLGKFVR